jgi:outer membrane protein assembly factor BamB
MNIRSQIGQRLAASCLLSSLCVAAVHSASWPQFRGPDRSGVARDESLLDAWPEDGPREVWHRPFGAGYSSIAVVGSRLFTMSADDSGEYVVSLDTADGAPVWKTRLGDFVESELGDGGPRATPTVADDTVYTVSSQSKLVALKRDSGTLIWEIDLAESGPVPRFGYSISPLVDRGVVIVEMGRKEEGPGVTAFDLQTGEPKWSALNGPAGYSSPIVQQIGSVAQYVLFRAAGRELVGLSTTGEILWRHSTPEALSAIPTPIFHAPNRVFLSTSEDAFGGRMLEISADNAGFTIDELWQERLMRNHFNSSVLVNGYLFGFDNGTLRCLNADSGEKIWAKRGFGKGSLISADGMLVVLSDSGTVALVRASPDSYQELGRKQVMTGRAWTSPSLANGRLYVRDFDEIVSLDVALKPDEGRIAGASEGLK